MTPGWGPAGLRRGPGATVAATLAALLPLLTLLATVLVVLLGAVAPAGAHGGPGTMGIEVTPGTAPLTARVRVLLEYANDREVAPGATVVAQAVGPDGATVDPTPLTDQGQGSYEAVLTVPTAGAWTVTVSADDPAATASEAVTVSAAPTSTTIAAGEVEISADRTTRDRRRSDDGPSPALLAAIAVVLVAAVGVAFGLVRRR